MVVDRFEEERTLPFAGAILFETKRAAKDGSMLATVLD
jgi:hypothetical protein